jgi:hypothetical protein
VIARVLTVVLGLALGGCGGDDDEAPAPGRGIVTREPATVSAPVAPPPRRTDRRGPPRGTVPLVPGLMAPAQRDPATPLTIPPETPVEPTMEETPAPPDREAELRALVGDPASCIPRSENPPAQLSISVSATVSVTGVVTRREVHGAGLSEDAIECIGARLDSARFRGPVENAPRTIRATLELRWQAPEPTMTDPTMAG